jgi:hypothetical protein
MCADISLKTEQNYKPVMRKVKEISRRRLKDDSEAGTGVKMPNPSIKEERYSD